jgi:hypothetical protein
VHPGVVAMSKINSAAMGSKRRYAHSQPCRQTITG